MAKSGLLAVFLLTTALSSAALAAPPGRGGGFGGGGGGAPHPMGAAAMPHPMGGGGAPHFGGGSMAHFGAAGGSPHIGGGGVPHFAAVPHGGPMRFGGAAHLGGPHVTARPMMSRPPVAHFAAHPNFRTSHAPAGRSSAVRFANHGTGPDVNHSALGQDRTSKFNQAHANLQQTRQAVARTNAVHNVLSSRAVEGALRNRTALLNPNSRAQIAAVAATAGWQGSHMGAGGWWRHRHGGYGWIGPVFWPFAYYDLYDYTLWGYGYDDPFWDYGYVDIYAGLFAPYGYDDLVAYLPPGPSGSATTVGQVSGTRRTAASEDLVPFCGDDSRGIADLPIDQIQQAIQPNDAQRAALDELGNASIKAAQDIRAACPTRAALTAPDRLAAMQRRIEAMITAANTVLPPLQEFYDLLSDDQKVRLNALGQDQRKREASHGHDVSLAQSCGAPPPGVTNWPTAEIDARVHPTEAQRASLAALQDASAKAVDMLKNECPVSEPITPPARLKTVVKRLDTMLQAVKTVRSALEDFYGKLTDEQKAQFESIGPQRSALADRPIGAPTHVHRRHHAGVEGLIRHFMSMARW